jgi:signal transduction histidine kinase
VNLEVTPSGIPTVGALSWGTHVCQFYAGRDDLTDYLVPYFKIGLEHDQYCLWVTSDPLTVEDAQARLRAAVPDVDSRAQRGQIEFVDYRTWYVEDGRLDADRALAGWAEREQRALAQGYAGARVTGNAFWLETSWPSFADYEAKLKDSIAGRRMICLCSYSIERCPSLGLLGVVEYHDYAVVRHRGTWTIVESASVKETKEELSRLNEELERRVRERTEELRRALVIREQFLSAASHELKTPLTAMQLYLDTLVEAFGAGDLSEEERRRRLERAAASCRRLGRLIENLLDVSATGLALPAIQREEVDLSKLAGKVVARFAPLAQLAGCEVTFRADRPVIGQWDPARLDQILTALLGNAFTHARGAPVEVTIEDLGDRARLTVRDAGPGIAPEDQARIFERFAQTRAGAARGGFGLGLWIVRQNATAMGGTVGLESAPGRGATFRVELPRS